MRRKEHGSPSSAPTTPPARGNNSPTFPSNQPIPAHIRRRMGQVVSGDERMGENATPTSPEKNPSVSSSPDEDFKSLFGNSSKKKKKKTSEDDEDFSLDEELGDDEDLPLLDDEK